MIHQKSPACTGRKLLHAQAILGPETRPWLEFRLWTQAVPTSGFKDNILTNRCDPKLYPQSVYLIDLQQ